MYEFAETDLEKQFEDTFKKVHPQIQEKLEAAAALIDEAAKMSEDNGIPFRPDVDIMFCSPSYIPESMNSKFPDLDWDFVSSLTSAGGDERYSGWQSSQIC